MNHNPYSPPEAIVGDGLPLAQIELRPTRGGWLATLLTIMIVANLLTAVVYSLVVIGRLALPGRAAWVGQTLLLLVVGNIAFLFATWNWRKWGVYGLVGMSILVFVLNISLGQQFLSAALGLLGLVLIIAAVYPRWKYFK